MKGRATAIGLLLALALASCTKDENLPPVAGAGGSGGSGGSGGAGGAGGGPGDGPDSRWEGMRPVEHAAWDTLGDVTTWQKGRFGPEGQPGYAFGGNGVGAVTEEGILLWRLGVDEGAPAPEQILDLQVVRLDGRDHVLATTMKGDALLVDGEDGSLVWSKSLSYLEDRRAELVLLGTEEEPLFFSIFGEAVHSVRTGEVAWEHALGEAPLYAISLPRPGETPLVILTIDRGFDRGEEEADVFAFTVEGEPVFSATSERFVTQLATAPIGADGSPALVVGTNDARLVAFASDGDRLWTRELSPGAGDTWNDFVDQLLVADIDEDGSPELFVELEGPREGATLLSLGADGAENWRSGLKRDVSLLEWIPTEEGPRLVLAYGGAPHASDVATLDARAGDDLGSLPGLRGVMGLFHAHAPGKLFAGLVDGQGYFVDGGGVELAVFVGGSVLQTVPQPSEGALVVTRWGIVASVDEPRVDWTTHFDPAGRTSVGESHVFDEAGETILAVSGRLSAMQQDPGAPAFHFLHPDGERLPTLAPAKEPTAFGLAKLGDDAAQAIVTVHYPTGSSELCTLAAYDRARGKLSWETELAECLWVWLAAGDADGDGRDEVAVTGFRQGFQAFVGLVDAAGELRWLHRFPFLPYWTLTLPRGVAVGGAADDGNGFAAFYDAASGEKRWETKLPRWRDPEAPLETRQGFSYFATAVGDRDEDGFDEIALTTTAGEAYLLDGATGEIRWRAWIREDGGTAESGGGPIAWVPATEETPAYLVATEQDGRAVATTTAVFDLRGERRGAFTSRGGVASLTVRQVEGGAWRVGLAERYGARLLGVEAVEPEED